MRDDKLDDWQMAEYKSLRDEIQGWQNRRFMLLAGCATLVGAAVGFSPPSGVDPRILSASILVVLTIALLLTRYMAHSNSRIAAYIVVFYEGLAAPPALKWESRLHKLEQGRVNVNTLIGVTYGILGMLGSLAAFARRASASPGQATSNALTVGLFVIASGFVVCLFLTLFDSYPRQRFIREWETVRNKEK